MGKKLVVIIVVVLVAAAAAFFLLRNSRTTDGAVRVSGNIEITSVEASFKIPGRVMERLVDEGMRVEAGQLVARLDSSDLAKEVALRQADVQAARAALAELEAGSRKEEIGQAEATLERAEAEATRAEADFKRVKSLFEREVVARRDLDNARAAVDAATANVRLARESLSLSRKGPRQERIDQGRARAKEAEAALAIARERLSYAALTAPSTGMVMAKHVEPGEQVATGTPVVTIGDMENTWVRAYINETDLGRVKLGQKVNVTTDTYPGKSYPGTVSFIASEAEFTPKNVQTQKERVKLVYRIKITIPNPDMELKPGMPADGEILTSAEERKS
ncbi:efflux RND transporter periplasmic adaptor subunit [Geomobilimonas luticola]|uniref:Efflux RND transporter periplasmic adaptor subunit n=1 Tax=Geomobilimonas luticola TaxID=1114878 RepID=A0ABS5SI95_9BACT|nr:efflux RND transporter periplasmic adaptor subunit [Geomobilimonas luticola]